MFSSLLIKTSFWSSPNGSYNKNCSNWTEGSASCLQFFSGSLKIDSYTEEASEDLHPMDYCASGNMVASNVHSNSFLWSYPNGSYNTK